jgi:hypothetical protein
LALQKWQAELELAIEDLGSGEALFRHAKTYPSLRYVMGPQEVVIRPDQRYVNIHIPGPLGTYAFSQATRSLLVLATDTPGVRYCVSQKPIGNHSLSLPRLIWDFSDSETVLNADFITSPTPSYDADYRGTWLNHTNWANTGAGVNASLLRCRHQNVSRGGVNREGTHVRCPAQVIDVDGNGLGLQPTQDVEARIVFGKDGRLNLGGQPDGNTNVCLGLWLYVPSEPIGETDMRVSVGSYPFSMTLQSIGVEVTNIEDVGAAIGGVGDSYYTYPCTKTNNLLPVGSGYKGYYKNITIEEPVPGEWCFFELPLADFDPMQTVSEVNGDVFGTWEAITWMSVAFHDTNQKDMWFGPMTAYTKDYPLRHLDLCAVETFDWRKLTPFELFDPDQGITLTLMPPPGFEARVSYFLGAQ